MGRSSDDDDQTYRVHNVVRGDVSGPVVQAGRIDGGLTLHGGGLQPSARPKRLAEPHEVLDLPDADARRALLDNRDRTFLARAADHDPDRTVELLAGLGDDQRDSVLRRTRDLPGWLTELTAALADLEAAARTWGDYLGSPVDLAHREGPSPHGTTGYGLRFQRGSALWCSDAGPRALLPGMHALHRAQGGASGWLGFPLADELSVTSPHRTDGSAQRFQGGTAYQCGERAFAVRDTTGALFERHGFPLGSPLRDGSGWVQEFEGGQVRQQ
ncbi:MULTISPECIES: LGFP repeat-containing protein [Actinosynnema]|uniref:LGFP repeat-containing protein n=1 Tax=Actinosynnema TaxID=40566 RepID=UPI0020A38C0E|nr:hypothetical protein [Actinosynnema pretiosum]MCP2092474.1 hypothetical protein [Actinosynnema pretiosum]